MTSTTICVEQRVKLMLDELKKHPREPYNSVIERLASRLVDDEPLSNEAIEGIEEALEDIKHARLYSEEEILHEFDVQ